MNCAVKNGIGDCTSYKENGAMDIYRPIKNYQFNGTAEVYSENGRLWATLHYNNGHLISAECINDRKNGKKWTKAEISNWVDTPPYHSQDDKERDRKSHLKVSNGSIYCNHAMTYLKITDINY